MSNAIKPTPWQADVLAAPEDINLALFGGRGRGATTCALLLIIRACENTGIAITLICEITSKV